MLWFYCVIKDNLIWPWLTCEVMKSKKNMQSFSLAIMDFFRKSNHKKRCNLEINNFPWLNDWVTSKVTYRGVTSLILKSYQY